uniref:Uncharacterized protein n=1 Tax=uncultured bacterium A1Q1_fos_962 TaxID=1256592 RepID=L7VXJ7_9BACT|nr:hypothetical protein [uncultured bacterium A1Q1_fos_962]
MVRYTPVLGLRAVSLEPRIIAGFAQNGQTGTGYWQWFAQSLVH